jgi:hypothetical protein
MYHASSKHIETRDHFVREKIQSNEIDLLYCITNVNVAHIFTKPLGEDKFVICRDKICVIMVSQLRGSVSIN